MIRIVGRGSYGDVWLARGLTGTFRAVKVVWRDRFPDLQPFHREFEGLKQFATVSLTDAGQLAMLHVGRNESAGFFYYVMELADDVATGRDVDPDRYTPLTLKEMRARSGRLPAKDCVSLGAALAGGLSHLHSRGLVHRDVKPSNVILVDGKPKLADIGLVTSASDASTFVGTEGFVPPEGPGTPSADVFSLGKLLYEISTGLDRHDFPRLPADLEKLPDRAGLLELNEILLRACAPAASDRYPSAAALLDDLLLLEAGRSVRRRRTIGRAIRACAVVAALAAAAWAVRFVVRQGAKSGADTEARAAAPENSIAVLPFEALGGGSDEAAFADGMHEELVTQLAKIRDLKVVGHAPETSFRNDSVQLGRIAGSLGVAYVLEGAARRSGGQVRVNVRLTDARSGRRVREDSFDRSLNGLFSIQSALAQEIAGVLHTDLTAGQLAAINRLPTRNLEAYQFYLEARAIRQEAFFEPEPLDRAVGLYEKAVGLDPDFALAYARLALLHGAYYLYGNLDATPGRLARMKAAVDAAVRLAPDLPETRMALGYYDLIGLNDVGRAVAEYRAAEAGLPNDDQLLGFLGGAELRAGDWAQALVHMGKAATLDPQDVGNATNLCALLMFLRHYAEARSLAVQAAPRFPESRLLPRLLARAQYQIDGDRAAFLHRWASVPLLPEDPHGIAAAFDLAMLYGDFALAGQVLDDPRMPMTFSAGHSVQQPVAMNRALVAFLRGQGDAARLAADEAITFYKSKHWNAVQEPAVDLEMGLANALAGRAPEAIRLARAGMDQVKGRNGYLEADARSAAGLVFASLGRTDDAIASLREMMAGPCRQTPQEIRRDPLWSRVAADPRFEAILKSATRL